MTRWFFLILAAGGAGIGNNEETTIPFMVFLPSLHALVHFNLGSLHKYTTQPRLIMFCGGGGVSVVFIITYIESSQLVENIGYIRGSSKKIGFSNI